MTASVGQGGTLTLTGTYQDGTGQAVDPIGPTVEILDPSDVQVVAPTVPTRNPSVGVYEYDFVADVAAPLGTWTARWAGTINAVYVTGDATFTVVEAGTVGADTDESLVTVDAFAARLGQTLDATDTARAQAVLDDVSAIVRSEGRANWTRATVPAQVKAVVFAAARRAWSNPDGMTYQQIDDYSVRWGAGTGSVYLTRDDLRIVRRAAGTSNVTTVRVHRPGLRRASALLAGDPAAIAATDPVPWRW